MLLPTLLSLIGPAPVETGAQEIKDIKHEEIDLPQIGGTPPTSDNGMASLPPSPPAGATHPGPTQAWAWSGHKVAPAQMAGAPHVC